MRTMCVEVQVSCCPFMYQWLAYSCYSNHQVAYDQMGEMLELIDAARWWVFNEQEEAWALGMLDYYPPGPVS